MSSKFKPCSIDGCGGNAHYSVGGKRGWCRDHYGRWQRHGNPVGGTYYGMRREQWLRNHVGYAGGDCLLWPFKFSNGRYPPCYFNGAQSTAHRVMCELVNGPPPFKGAHAAHSCGNGLNGCVHPKHLRWATSKQNQEDIGPAWPLAARVTECEGQAN